MDIEKLDRIGAIAESMGFEVRIQNKDYATFNAWKNGFCVEVVFDKNRELFVNETTYISSSSVNSDDLDVFREFTAYLQKAIVIADKLKETKVNGA